MSRALVLLVVLAGCGARTDVGHVARDASVSPDASISLDASAARDTCTDGPPRVTDRDGRPLPCGGRACDPRTELCYDCTGGGGCSGPSHCVPLGECGAMCDPCGCARPLVQCSYSVYCSLRNDVLTLVCPPD